MDNGHRYLLGKGESLSGPVQLYGGGGDKIHPYSLEIARARLRSPIATAAETLRRLPDSACPRDEAVAVLTLHPSYIARSYFPDELIGAVGLRSMGSRVAKIKPEKGNKKQQDLELTTVELFVAGRRAYFERWALSVGQWSTDNPGAEQLRSLERVYAEEPSSRIRSSTTESKSLEAILHVNTSRDEYIVEAFTRYVEELGGRALSEDRIQAGGLCYIAVELEAERRASLAEFAFLRGLREMPQIKSFDPFRSAAPVSFVMLPTGAAQNPHLRVAIFDGGLPSEPNLTQWVRAIDAGTLASPLTDGTDHGLAVTSSVLFGPINNGAPLSRPLTNIDHHRIADVNDAFDPTLTYYRLLNRIVDVLKSEHYDYINISLGPKVAMDDDIVHAWTAKLDEILSHGKTLAFFAAGNTGEEAPPGNRIGPPADAVNALGIGSADDEQTPWDLATYSSVGPGRSPGVMKPDIVTFGGCDIRPFGALAPGLPLSTCGVVGTSFASPYAMRLALQLAAYFGHALTPLAVKSLLIHHAERMNHHNLNHVGWGKIPSDYLDLVTCSEDTVSVVYQGVLHPGKTLRAAIPCPAAFGNTRVTIAATICYATEIEPQNPASYTRAGLDVHFRPHSERRKSSDQRHANTATFFRSGDYAESEAHLRTDALKWETVISKMRRFSASSLMDPVFDLHHVARYEGGAPSSPPDIPYGMVVTVRQNGSTTLYNDIVSRYRTQLQAVQPQLGIPVRVYGVSK